MSTYERQDSHGWADQWDKHFDEGGPQGRRKRSKMAKVKAAATSSVERTVSAATVSAQMVKSGTSSSLRWIKDKVQRKRDGESLRMVVVRSAALPILLDDHLKDIDKD